MNDFSFSNVLDAAWAFSKKHGLMLAVLLFVINLFIAGIVLSGFDFDAYQQMMKQAARGIEPDPNALKGMNRMQYIASLVQVVLYVGIYNMIMGIIKGHFKGITFMAWKLSLETYLKYVAVNIIYFVIVVAGAFCFFLPGIFFAVRLQFAGLAILDNPELGLMDAIKESWKRTDGHFFALFGLGLAYIIICIIGFLCLFVGSFFAMAMIMAATVYSYLLLDKNHNIEI